MLKTLSFILLTTFILIAHQACSIPRAAKLTNEEGFSSMGFCERPQGVSGSPQTIEEVVELINALPKPVSVSCFLSSLDRPLKVALTNNPISAQPALGDHNPRIFIMNGNLFISVVPDGAGAKVVEFSHLTSIDTSIKAELPFPVTEALAPSAPYDHIRLQNGTTCAACHASEQRVSSITFAEAFASQALQPRTNSLVNLETFRTQRNACENVHTERCEIIKALFDFGEVRSQSFPSGMPYAFSGF